MLATPKSPSEEAHMTGTTVAAAMVNEVRLVGRLSAPRRTGCCPAATG